MTRLLVAGCVAVLSVAVVVAQTGQTTPSKPVASPVARLQAAPQAPIAKLAPAATEEATKSRALVDQYCVTCHNARLKTGGLVLDKEQLDFARLADHPEMTEKVIRKVRAGLMPPTNVRRPDAAAMESFVRFMETEVDAKATQHLPAPGLHRLNRTEYANAIRDLLSLEVDATKFLPPDDSTRGFDNIAGALTMSPALMEAYLSASGKISRLAIGDVSAPTQAVFDVPADTAQNHHIEGLPFGTRGGMLIKYQFPADGLYSFNVKGVTGYFQAVLGGITGEQLEVTIDGERVKLFDWDKEISNTTGNGKSTPRVPVTAGLHTLGVTFIATNDVPGTELNKPFQRTMNTPGSIPGFIFYPHVGQVIIEGPFDAKGAADTASRRKIFSCTPKTPREETSCARTIVSSLAKHAFRRPVNATDVNGLLEFYRAGREEGGGFDNGIESALQRILADPEFIYRGEAEPANLAAGKAYRISDLALASRLSFFLWSSIPDDELIDIAAKGQLKDPAVLEQQVKRMLRDPRSQALVTNFTGQWLGVRALKTAEPVVNLFPDFDDNLRSAFQKEIELFFASIVQEDRAVVDLLTANDTFVNERLAKHYGVPYVYGSQFRRVTLTEDARRGLLGKGAILMVTSRADRTAPVLRGKWILENVLGTPPPPPLPNVPPLVASTEAAPRTLRERMEQHRASPTCAGCHKVLDPLGFALENFDGVGAWRSREAGLPIDASGLLADGTKVDGVVALRNALVGRSDIFVQTLTEKLMIYALGRGLQHYDMPVVRDVVRHAAKQDYRFSSLVMGIVTSPPFQMRVAGDEDR